MSLGANCFRGGKNHYGYRTKSGNWVEDQYDPNIEKAYFTTSAYVSTSHHGMMKGIDKGLNLYGGGLPAPEHPFANYDDIFRPDKREMGKSWQSISHSMFRGPATKKIKDFACIRDLPPGMGDKVEEYRARWTIDSDVNRITRFATAQNISLNEACTDKYQTREYRFLPGFNFVLERVLRQILGLSPNKGIQVFRTYLNKLETNIDGMMSYRDFLAAIKEFGVNLPIMDREKLLEILDEKKTGLIDIKETLLKLRGKLVLGRINVLKTCFEHICEGKSSLSLEEIGDAYNAGHELVVKTGEITEEESKNIWRKRFAPYASNNGQIDLECFMEFYADLQASYGPEKTFILVAKEHWDLAH